MRNQVGQSRGGDGGSWVMGVGEEVGAQRLYPARRLSIIGVAFTHLSTPRG